METHPPLLTRLQERGGSFRTGSPGRQHPACTATPRMPPEAAHGSPPRSACWCDPRCTPHTLLYLLALEANKVVATRDPAERGQKAHGGTRRWEDPEIATSSECHETPGVCIQALSRALHSCRQQAGLAQPLDPRAGSHPSHGQTDELGRGLSKERFARAGTEPDPYRWKQSRSAPQQDVRTRAGTGRETPSSASAPADPAWLLLHAGRGCCSRYHL